MESLRLLFPFTHPLTVNTWAVPSTASVVTQTQVNGEFILEFSLFLPNGIPNTTCHSAPYFCFLEH